MRTDDNRYLSYSNQPSDNADDYIDIGRIIIDVLVGIRKFWILILLTVLICTGGMYFYASKKFVPLYESHTTVIIDPTSAVGHGDSELSAQAMQKLANTFPYIISNSAFRAMIASDLGVRGFNAQITATPMSGTNMMTIRVESSDPQESYTILQSALKNYPKIAKLVIGDTVATVLEEAQVAEHPYNWYSGRKYAVVGAIGGFGLWAGVLFLLSILRKTVRKEEDFQKVMNIKKMGSVPLLQTRKHRKSKDENFLITSRTTNRNFKSSIRMLRTKLEREQQMNDAKVFLVTSTLPAEGKSTIVSNLALSFEENGKSVMILDMDLRNPSIRKVMNLPAGEAGIADYINKNTSIEKLITTTGKISCIDGNFKSGQADIVRLLHKRKMQEIFDYARQHADVVLVDTPPCGIVLDSAILSRYVDLGVYVVRQNYAPIKRIREGVGRLESENLKICGWIMNMNDGTAFGYGYGYGGYGYGSKYGYGEEKKSKKNRFSNN